MLRNLFSNAIKFSKSGGKVNINVTATYSLSPTIMISVIDSGAGLTETNIQGLFKEGVQFNANTLQGGGGSGFGLYISKAITELHEVSVMT